MAKRGRPKKTGERYPSGKLKPEGRSLYWQRQLDALRQAEFDPLMASPIGQMLRMKVITTKAMEAAVRFQEQRMLADAALGLPPRHCRAQDMTRIHGLENANDDSEAARRKAKHIADYDRAESAIGLNSDELSAVQWVIIHDRRADDYEQLLALFRGIEKLMTHYGIAGTVRPHVSRNAG